MLMFSKETITAEREREREDKIKDKKESGGDKSMIIVRLDVNYSTAGLLTVCKHESLLL